MGKVTFKDVWKKYDEVEAVKGISFEADDEEFLVILGPSGAGKTSILKMIAGVEGVTGGEIYIDGQLANYLDPRERNVAMVFESYALYPHFSVYDNLAFPLRSPRYRRPENEIKERVTRVAGMMGMGDLLNRAPSQLSQGQKQRVGLGRALVRDPSVFLFDEPLSHVDAKIRHRMRMEMKKIEEQMQTTTIYVTHDYMEALSLGDRVIIIDEGVIQQEGPPREVFDHPVNIFVADLIGDPPMNFLDVELLSDEGEGKFCTEDGTCRLPVPAALKQIVADRTSSNFRMGIRPMFVSHSLTETANSHVQGTVYVFERFEVGGVLTVAVGDNLLRASTEPDLKVNIDQPVWLSLDLANIRVFDPETGLAVTS
jgi:multiple sugar transport system ATP-binding protein